MSEQSDVVIVPQLSAWRRRWIVSALAVTAIIVALAVAIFPRLQYIMSHTTPAQAAPATPSQVWGTSAIHSLTVGNLVAPSSPNFTPTDISPDGTFVVGYDSVVNAEGSNSEIIVAINLATGVKEQIIALPDNISVLDNQIATDGRYIAWAGLEYLAGPNPPYSQQLLTYFDTQTGKQHSITAQPAISQLPSLSLDHGHLFWLNLTSGPTQHTSPFVFEDTDLSSGETRDVFSSGTPHQIQGVCWPDVIYNNTLFDATSGISTPITMPTPPAPYYNVTIAACDGTTAYASYGTIQHGVQSTGFLETDIFAHTPLHWQDDGTIHGFAAMLSGANNRLFLFGGVNTITNISGIFAWDRQQHRIVYLLPDFSSDFTPRPFLRDHWLVYQTNQADKKILNVVDTTRLR